MIWTAQVYLQIFFNKYIRAVFLIHEFCIKWPCILVIMWLNWTDVAKTPLLPKAIYRFNTNSYKENQGHLSQNFSSVQFSRSVVSDSLWPYEPQHARPPGPSPTPGVHPYPCPFCQWCHPTISSSVVPFSSCPQLSQHQGLFKWISSMHQVANVLEFQLQHQSLQWTPRTDLI